MTAPFVVEVFRRSQGWASSYYLLGDDIHFESIDVSLSVEEIFESIDVSLSVEEIFESIDVSLSVEDIYESIENDDVSKFLETLKQG